MDDAMNGEDACPARIARENPRILFAAAACDNLRDAGSCRRCVLACPAEALSLEGSLPRIDVGACTACGICVGICDAFASSEVTTYDFAKRMERLASADGVVYLCCNEDLFDGLKPARNVVALNCLASLPPELLAYYLSTGQRLVLSHDLSYCEDCPTGGAWGAKLWQRSMEIAQNWTGRTVESADVIPEELSYADQMAAPDRRALFTTAIAAAGDVASGRYRARTSTAVDDFLARRDRMRATTRSLAHPDLFLSQESRELSEAGCHDRRRLLDEAIANDPSIADRISED